MASLDPRIDVVREKFGLSEDDFWELPQKRGTWIAKHAALEIAAVKADIRFDMPVVIEAKAGELVTSIIVQGTMGGRTEWSIGETNPTNYHVSGKQPSYPWAMAEKRAKDRVILKLIGIHGLTYSEDEADDFAQPGSAPAQVTRISADRAKKVLNFPEMIREIDTAETLKILNNWDEFYRITAEPWLPYGWSARLLERISQRREEMATEPVGGVDPNTSLDRQFRDTVG